MKIVVTGGFGFIGSFLVDELLKKGYEVSVIDVRTGDINEGAELCVSDITNYDEVLESVKGADIVYHLAGTVLGTARKNPYLAARLDILGTTNVLEACVRNGVKKIIYASSFYVYDGLPASIQVDENDHSDIFKAEFFGVVKLVGERLILEYAKRYGLEYIILRFGPVYGPHDRCSSVVCDFIKEGLRGNPLIIWGRGERKNQYTYVEDIARGCIKALNFKNEVFNLISPQQVTIREVAEFLSQKYGFKVKYDLTKPEGPSMPYISPRKAMDKLKWSPLSLEKGIERTISRLRNNHV